MNRRKPELQALDVTTWPTVAWTELDVAAREHFRARMQAIERYARGEPVRDIEEATGVNRQQLYRSLERALKPHRDGRIFGFRALIAHVRVTEYIRLRPVNVRGKRGGRGAMPPDACLPRRHAKALKPPRFPILTFDEWQLRLALDGVFNVSWLMPGESLLSILWKFACANALPGHVLLHLVCPTADPSEGVVPVRDAINLKDLCRLIRLPQYVMLVSLLDGQRHARYHTNFRFCRQCAAHGYHSVLHQLEEEDLCPAHQQSLETHCPHCGRETPYIVSASVIEAPFRCVWCHLHYSYGRLSLLSTTPAMRRQDRLAISCRLLLRLGKDTGAADPEQTCSAPC